MKATQAQLFTSLLYSPYLREIGFTLPFHPEAEDVIEEAQHSWVRRAFEYLFVRATTQEVAQLLDLHFPVYVSIKAPAESYTPPHAHTQVHLPFDLPPILLHHGRACVAFLSHQEIEVKPMSDAPCLLTQANRALLNGGFTDGITPLDIPMMFHLAGLLSPKSWDDWRVPDGEQVPHKANLKGNESFGDVTVHCHNGIHALITHNNDNSAMTVHVKSLVNSEVKELKSFIAKNTPANSLAVAELKAMTDEKARELAEKWF